MKNTPAVFLTSLAVSVISLTVPMPAATTVLDLFIGEDIAVQDLRQTNSENSQHTIPVNNSDGRQQEHSTSSGCRKQMLLRKLEEQFTFTRTNAETAFPLISTLSILYEKSKRTFSDMPEETQLATIQYSNLPQL